MARTGERWDAWVARQRDDPDSTVGQLMTCGISLETALIITMLGKIHEELATLADAADDPDDNWRHPPEDE